MTRSHLFTVAALLSLVACTNNPSATVAGPINRSPLPLPPGTAMIAGRISVSGQGADRVVELRDHDDDVYRLVGAETGALASVDGGDVIAYGTWDANPGFVVQEFQVVGMYGEPALDGVLEVSEEGFALRLADGSIRLVSGLSSESSDYVGARLWVIGWDASSDVVFGVIGAQ
jgi:hypothetical protein